MTKTSKGVIFGFFLTTFVILWIIYSYATQGVILSSNTAAWLLALITSAALTVVFARYRPSRR